MVVRLRLQRWGNRHNPFYRVVVANANAPRDGKFIDRIGTYDPHIDHTGRKKLTLNFERAKYWLSVGAQPSDTVARLLHYADLLPEPPKKLRTKSAESKQKDE